MSQLHRVVEPPAGDAIVVEDDDGTRHSVSLIAYDGPSPEVGSWLVAHSGYALGPIGEDEALRALRDVARGRANAKEK